ncbi:MAG: N-acetylneuraminate synthase family protein, partial [Alphaproteobacteria bacterium]|nr:N-acetylneuraminate synthase family protein [Alphaproteobacteria bacterium]
MSEIFDFNDLFVFDMANNHQGCLGHGLQIIEEVGAVARKHNIRGVIKFQFRQLDTFIHPNHTNLIANKHIERFASTFLKIEDYKKLFKAVKAQGMLTMCTPFDEESVELIEQMGFDIIKVASCSAKDWPLLERISSSNLPVIFSTGGLTLNEIGDLVSFFEHRGGNFAIMHCVSIYPTPDEKCNLNQIDVLKSRYPNTVIGWSTHEEPDNLFPVTLAIAKGARIFERHVGVSTNEITLNAYSSTPAQINEWIKAAKKAFSLCGQKERFPDADELASIETLKRGVFAKTSLKKGQLIKREDVFFAMPYISGQLDSGEWKEGVKALKNLKSNEPLLLSDLDLPPKASYQVIKECIHEV